MGAVMAEPRPQRWKRRKKARPQEILDAALGVFAQKGFARTRMEDIAQQAGVTKGTIYLYFENKEDVLKSLVRSSIGTTLDSAVANIDRFTGSSRDLLRTVLTAISRAILTDSRVVLPKIIVAESGAFPEMARFYRDEIIDKGLGLLAHVVERGIAHGEFRDVPNQHVTRICIAPLLVAAIWRTTFAQFDSEPYDYEGLIETHIDILLRGLAAQEGATA